MKKWLVFQHVPHEGPAMIATWLRENNQELVINELWREAIKAADEFTGLIVMGGPMSVNEEEKYDFIRPELKVIETFLNTERPVLGICLGSQLLARALGAKVYPGQQKEIGWYPIRFTEAGLSDAVLKPRENEQWVFHWHGETFDLPAGARLLASSDAYAHQAFGYGDRAYGLQFHAEMTKELIDEWLKINRQEVASLGAGKNEEIQADTEKHLHEMQDYGREVIKRFVRLASEE